jgi:hypothetical protein
MSIETEDTGKIFEMAICLTYEIEYDGKFKYDIEKAKLLKNKLTKLPELFPKCIHTAKKGSRYDFTTVDEKHLSAKSTKKGVGKVAPQVVGQAQPQKLCEILKIEYISNLELKKYLQENIINILPVFSEYTFDSPIIYYNKQLDSIRFITLESTFDWSTYEFSWTSPWDKWNNSTTLKIKDSNKFVPIMEIQFHTKSRTNLAIRWYFENLLNIFKKNLKIIIL